MITLESYINNIDRLDILDEGTLENGSMMMANEGKIMNSVKNKFAKIFKKHHKENPTAKVIYEKGSTEYNERKKIYNEAKKVYFASIRNKHGNVKGLHKISDSFDSDDVDNFLDDFCSGRDASIPIVSYDAWDGINTRREAEKRSSELFDIMYEPLNELKKINEKLKLDCGGDWDDGTVDLIFTV